MPPKATKTKSKRSQIYSSSDLTNSQLRARVSGEPKASVSDFTRRNHERLQRIESGRVDYPSDDFENELIDAVVKKRSAKQIESHWTGKFAHLSDEELCFHLKKFIKSLTPSKVRQKRRYWEAKLEWLVELRPDLESHISRRPSRHSRSHSTGARGSASIWSWSPKPNDPPLRSSSPFAKIRPSPSRSVTSRQSYTEEPWPPYKQPTQLEVPESFRAKSNPPRSITPEKRSWMETVGAFIRSPTSKTELDGGHSLETRPKKSFSQMSLNLGARSLASGEFIWREPDESGSLAGQILRYGIFILILLALILYFLHK